MLFACLSAILVYEMNLLWKSQSLLYLIKKTRVYNCRSLVDYVQGQYFNNKTREYFYFIDHQGQLFLDDAKVKNFISCFQDKEFLAFFFKRVKLNTTGRYEVEFPYVSPCGREKNYIRCDVKHMFCCTRTIPTNFNVTMCCA